MQPLNGVARTGTIISSVRKEVESGKVAASIFGATPENCRSSDVASRKKRPTMKEAT